MKKVFDFILDNKLIIVFAVIIIAIILYGVVNKIINNQIKKVAKSKLKNVKKHQTYLKLMSSISRYIILILTILVCLQIYGVNISSMIAGLGIISAIVGLALQDAFKDIIAGFNIIVDNYFSVGDFVEIDGVQGKILEVDLKTTRIKDIYNDNVLIISNRNILKALHISDVLDIEIPVGYEHEEARIEKIIKGIIDKTKKKEKIKDIIYLGINRFDDSAIVHKIRIYVTLDNRFEVKRNTLKLIKETLDKEKIAIPYRQVDIHNIK